MPCCAGCTEENQDNQDTECLNSLSCQEFATAQAMMGIFHRQLNRGSQ